jgi:hypothetical protein
MALELLVTIQFCFLSLQVTDHQADALQKRDKFGVAIVNQFFDD